jgi:hypothetical protein
LDEVIFGHEGGGMSRLWTYLKNTDLHAMSAFEALQGVMGYTPLKRLRRFQLFELSISLEEALQGFKVLNPNKEGYFVDKLPAVSIGEDEQLFLCKVLSDSKTKWIIWEILVDKSVTKEDVLANVLLSTSRKKGLLVNPVYEDVVFLDTADVCRLI